MEFISGKNKHGFQFNSPFRQALVGILIARRHGDAKDAETTESPNEEYPHAKPPKREGPTEWLMAF